MVGTITFGDKAVLLEANAATPYRYKQVFHKDLLKIITHGAEDSEAAYVAMELAYIMAMSAERRDMNKLSEESCYEWLSGFNPNDIYTKAQEIMDLYNGNMISESESKKNPEVPTGN